MKNLEGDRELDAIRAPSAWLGHVLAVRFDLTSLSCLILWIDPIGWSESSATSHSDYDARIL